MAQANEFCLKEREYAHADFLAPYGIEGIYLLSIRSAFFGSEVRQAFNVSYT
ncbi:hypothetical protein SAMN05216332_101438 [Nitrosospira briensis]|nr:hypothetical protein SAMN05216332_101438 [Nitrosospira briensis]